MSRDPRRSVGRLPRLSRGRWIGLTSAGAAFANAPALLVTTFWETLSEWAIGVQVAVFASGGAVLLLTIGDPQWLELRHRVPRAGRWVAEAGPSRLRRVSPC